MTDIVVLAAGKGTRMKSSLPKVLHKLAGKTMLNHVLDTASYLPAAKLTVVTGHGSEQVRASVVNHRVNWAEQTEQLGTGHAVAQAVDHIADDGKVLVLYGDVPLIKQQTLDSMLALVSAGSMALLTVKLADPKGYGRIVRDKAGVVTAIAEHKDATAEQHQINEVNTGVMALNSSDLKTWLPMIGNNNTQGEYYLTDLIEIAKSQGRVVNTHFPTCEQEVEGINDRVQLSKLERFYQGQVAEELMRSGATLADPSRIDCRGNIEIGTDLFIDINCVFEGNVQLGSNVVIGPNCVISDSTIGDNTEIKANTILENVVIGELAAIGPFARLRPGTELADGVKIGNFVETKKAKLGLGSKVSHLSYIGDAELGKDVNIGAGTITCNYDGVNKFKTEIGDNAFIGSNSSLVAPVNIGEGATVGAGSVINQSVPDNQLGVTRAKQRNLSNWSRPIKKGS